MGIISVYIAAGTAALLYLFLAVWARRRQRVVVGSLFIWKRLGAKPIKWSVRQLLQPLLCAITAALLVVALLGSMPAEKNVSGSVYMKSNTAASIGVSQKISPRITQFWVKDDGAYVAVSNPSDKPFSAAIKAVLHDKSEINAGEYSFAAEEYRIVKLDLAGDKISDVEALLFGDSRKYYPVAALECKLDSREYPYLALALEKSAGVKIKQDKGGTNSIMVYNSYSANNSNLDIIYCCEDVKSGVVATGRTFSGIIQPTRHFPGWNDFALPVLLVKGIPEYRLPDGATVIMQAITDRGAEIPLVAFWESKLQNGNRNLTAFFAFRSGLWAESVYFAASVKFLTDRFIQGSNHFADSVVAAQGIVYKDVVAFDVVLWAGIVSFISMCGVALMEMLGQKKESV